MAYLRMVDVIVQRHDQAGFGREIEDSNQPRIVERGSVSRAAMTAAISVRFMIFISMTL